MKPSIYRLFLIFSLTLISFSLQAQDSVAVPTASVTCVACHGPGGKSMNDLWPSLAGQKQGYLLKQLQDFKSGARKDPLMAGIMQTLSPSDIESLAKYFSSLK